ncbi:MAG: AMP-dependent synthetase/ligase [Acidimicrobiales bacterium]
MPAPSPPDPEIAIMIRTSEISRAEIDAAVEGDTLTRRFLDTVNAHGDRVALRWRTDDAQWHEMTFAEMADAVARAAAGLLELGVGPDERIVLMLRNRPEFHILDTAALMIGATPVSIYNSSSTDQVAYLANDAGAVVAIAGNPDFHAVIERARPDIPTLRTVVAVDPVEGADLNYAALLDHAPADLDDLAAMATPDTLCTLIYTSGTTGPSKGVMLDHANACWTAESLRRAAGIEDTVGQRLVSYLPMAHIAERMTSHYQTLLFGYEVTCCPDPTQVAAYAAEVRPNIMFGVPRVWEKIAAGVAAVLAADPEKEKAVAEGVEVAAPIREKMTWGTATPEEIETYQFLDAVAFSTIRQAVGLDELVLAISGAAPIPAEVLSWFRTIGVPLSEIYGLSETSGPLTWAPFEVKPGLVGPPCPGMEVRLDPDGEVLARGGNIFRGYLNQPRQTAEVFDADGWFRTGDIGVFDDDGYLRIVDRKKELIITAGGKNLSPSNLEAALKTIPLVGQAIAVGDQRPFVSALVVLDPDVAPQWAARHGLEGVSLAELAADTRVVAEIEAGLVEAMAPFNHAEKVKKVTVLGEEWLPDTDLLTPTSKLKRRGIHARYAAEIEAMYQR